MWDPQQYLAFADERARPFHDLVQRVEASGPGSVVDLGCGPGNLTAFLKQRWPDARVVGVDSSSAMIDRAAEVPGIEAVHTDLGEWEPEAAVDVLISNATLQWVPDHLDLLPKLVSWLGPGGWLAVQVPGNFGEPSHVLLREVSDSPRWRDRIGLGRVARPASHDPAVYLDALVRLGLRVDAWETTYLQVLDGENAVLEWVTGTALRPVLDVLDDTEQTEFMTEYGALLRAVYPRREYGTVLPYRRVFVVAHRQGGQ